MAFGKAPAIGQALSRLVRAGVLRRVRHGIYDLPRSHPLIGQTAPDPTGVVQALMKDSGAQWQFTGAYAANLLGLSEQVPAQIEVLTSGVSRKVQLGRLTLVLRHASPRNLLGAGRPAGLVIQAVRHLRRDDLPVERLDWLRSRLDAATRRELRSLVPDLPVWMQPIITRIATDPTTP